MPALVTPNKVVQFCSETFKRFCSNNPKPVQVVADDLNTNSYYLGGGTTNIAIGPHGRKTPVVQMNNDFWLHFSISFEPKNKLKGKSHELLGLSLQLFKEINGDFFLLFRCEWDNGEINEYQHPQPHWHFHHQMDFVLSEKHIDSFNSYLDLVEENTFIEQITRPQKKKINDISSFHFAMASRWQNKESAIIPLNEQNLRNWLDLVLHNIFLQLTYCFA